MLLSFINVAPNIQYDAFRSQFEEFAFVVTRVSDSI